MGRDHLLSLLSDKLRDTTARKYNHRVAIYGMGGVGKTQLAIEYVYRNEAKYHSIFWISSADQAALLSGFGEIARVTGCVPNLDVGRNPDEVAKSVLIWLRKQDGWLLVMDNMDEISVAADYLPHMAPGGHTLITTRNPDHFTIPAEGLQIPVLGEDAAIELLLLRCQITCADESPDRTHAAHIVRELGCLALAIEQAAAFIRSSIGIDEFLAIYHKSRHQFLRRELSKNHPYPTSVAATFLLSLNRLDSVENGAQAIALLRLLAFLNPDGVLIDFLRSGSRGLDDAIREIIDDEFVFHDTLEILQRYALVGLSQNKDNVVIHRLVQAVVKDMLDETEIDTFRESVIGLCKSAFPDLDIDEAPTIAERIECRRLQNQILEPVIEAAEAYSLKGSKLLCKIGHFLHWEGKYHDSERVERLRVRINSDFLGENDPVTLCSLHALGSTLWRSGKLNEAADLMEKASQGLIRALGEEHLDTLRSMTEFALILRRQGKLDQATVMAKKVLETTIKVFGEEHIDRLSAMANLALALSSQGELDQAAALQEKVLEGSTKVRGAEHPDTLTALSNHAQTLSGQGKFEQAAAMEEKVLEARIKVLGEEDPDTLTALAKLAAMLWRQGMFDQAATMLEKVLATRIKVLGEEHPDTLTGMSNLALFYKDLGRRLEAIDTLKKAVDGMRKVLGVDHPDTLDTIKLYNEWLTKENSVRPSEAYLMV